MFQTRLKILKEIFPNSSYQESKKELFLFCPEHEHHKRKLQINIESGRYQCWVCGIHGYVLKLLKKHGTNQQYKEYCATISNLYYIEPENEIKIIQLPGEYKFILNCQECSEKKVALSWLEKLGISKEVIIQNKIGICLSGEYKDRIIFPSFDRKGKINFFETRSLYNSFLKYKHCQDVQHKTIVYNELYFERGPYVVLTESVKTYLKHFGRINFVPIFGTSMNDTYKIFAEILLNDIERVYILPDADAYSKSFEIANLFINHGIDCKVAKIKGQADELSTNETILALKNAKNYDWERNMQEKIMEI